MRWSELAPELSSSLDPQTQIDSIEYDSRRVRPGSLFVAVRGQHHDGHDFVASALEAGAEAAVVEEPPPDADRGRLVVVEDTLVALAQLAASFYGNPSRALPVVGVTGTDGKTTTSIMLQAALQQATGNAGSLTTVDFRVGTEVRPNLTRQTTLESLEIQRELRRMADRGCLAAVVEATSHGLVLHRLDEIQFAGAVFTKITHEHLDFHKTWEAYFEAKATLLQRAAAGGGFAVLDHDDPRAYPMLLERAPQLRLSYSATGDQEADLYAIRLQPSASGTTFSAMTPAGETTVRLKMAGRWNVGNALAAIGAGLLLDQPLEPLSHGISNLAAVPGRMESVELGQSFAVVVDYAHTPQSLTLALHELRAATPNRLWVVFGSAGERDVAKRAEMGSIAARLADGVVITSEDPRGEDPEAIVEEIYQGAQLLGVRSGQQIVREPDRELAVALAIRQARPGDTVLLAGKGHEASIIGPKGPVPWSDREAAERAIRERLQW